MTITDPPAGAPTDLTLPTLQRLRLEGFAPASGLAERLGIDGGRLERCLDALAGRGLVARCRHDHRCWTLTAAGRAEGERLLAVELDAADERATVTEAYHRFRRLNPELLAICSAWQVVDLTTGQLNDHTDPAYDRAVIERLAAIDDAVQPITTSLARALDRFADYGPRLSDARAKAEAGDHRWLAEPLIASYHTVWFELHEDLLATLGLDRRTEAAAPT